MRSRHRLLIAVGVVVLSGVASVITASELPAEMATHWNAQGQPDGTMSKPAALAFLPTLAAVLLFVFALIPRIDPLRENIASFRPLYDWFIVVFTLFLMVLHSGIIAFNLGYEFDFTRLVLVAVAGLFYYTGVLLTHAERNWFVGIRTPWTLSNDEVWKRTHQLGGRLFKLTALLSIVGVLYGAYAVYFLIVPALLTTAITTSYSYYLYQQLEHDPEQGPPDSA